MKKVIFTYLYKPKLPYTHIRYKRGDTYENDSKKHAQIRSQCDYDIATWSFRKTPYERWDTIEYIIKATGVEIRKAPVKEDDFLTT